MEEGKFKIRSYGWQELALLYGEGLTPEPSTFVFVMQVENQCLFFICSFKKFFNIYRK